MKASKVSTNVIPGKDQESHLHVIVNVCKASTTFLMLIGRLEIHVIVNVCKASTTSRVFITAFSIVTIYLITLVSLKLC